MIDSAFFSISAATAEGEPHLLRDFAVITACGGAAMLLLRPLKMPPLLGYLGAGVLIGPSVLGAVQNEETIGLLAELGLVLLLFGIGLECGWRRIREVGARVVLIASVEMAVMFTLGFQIGQLMGWTDIEAVFLASAMSISSSAILMTMLRESGQLLETRGRLIIGILVVEDFAAVVLLSVLAGIASTGQADIAGIGPVVVKLAAFAILALVLGAAFANKLVNFVDRFKSEETLLIAGLTLCFGVALAAEQVGLSGAAGAFLIGAVLGDSQHAEQIGRTMGPVRTLFASLFFVSTGMLIDLALVDDFIVPILIVSAVFVVGKVVADTLGTFISGENERNSLSVGLGMPQMGEFSLAMVQTGAAFGAIGSFMFPVVTGATALTALAYPFLFRATDSVANFLQRWSPRFLRQYVKELVLLLATHRGAFRFSGPRARVIQRSTRFIMLDLGIIGVFLAIGTGLLNLTGQLSSTFRLSESMLGLLIGSAVLAFCIPPGLAIWRALRSLADTLVAFRLPGYLGVADNWTRGNLRMAFRDTALIPLLAVPGIWSIPMVSRLLALGSLSAPLSLLIIAVIVALLVAATFRVHRILNPMFGQAFLSDDDRSVSGD